MLDSKVISVRLGGIYALQRLAQEHPKQVKDKEAAREAQAEKRHWLERTIEARANLDQLEQTLEHTLSIDDVTDWEQLKDTSPST